MKSKLAMIIYILFAIASFFFGVQMFKMGDTLRGILFMVAVACWGMCIYNNNGTTRRQKQRMSPSKQNAMSNKKSKNKSRSR